MRFIDAALLSASLVLGMAGVAQTFVTIPETLARAGKSVTYATGIPSGVAPTLDRILLDTDLIVRGVVGQPKTYLSDDQTAVLTDYPVLRASILYARKGLASPPDPAALAVTLLGGEIEINGLTYTDRPAPLPALTPGSEQLLCLKVEGEKLMIAGRYFGAFAIGEEHLTPLTRKDGFAPEARQLSTQQMIATLKGRALELHAQGPRK
jgi:hypothetical protein